MEYKLHENGDFVLFSSVLRVLLGTWYELRKSTASERTMAQIARKPFKKGGQATRLSCNPPQLHAQCYSHRRP